MDQQIDVRDLTNVENFLKRWVNKDQHIPDPTVEQLKTPTRRTPQLSYRKHWSAMWIHAPDCWLARIDELRKICRWVQYTHVDNAIRVDFVLLTRCRPKPLILRYFTAGCILTGVSSIDRGVNTA